MLSRNTEMYEANVLKIRENMSLFITTQKIFIFPYIFSWAHIYSHEIVVSKIQIEEQNQSNYKISWVRPKLSNFKDVKL